jgi:hypothetical protein
MKKANKRPTRKQREANSVPDARKCSCGYVALSAYALKKHKGNCNA